MLSFFPAPYPGEWWYSVLCRYYVRSGILEHGIVKRQIFNGNENIHMGVLFPNQTVSIVTAQLPQKLFDTEKIILEHTPFKYYVRMYPLERRKKMLKSLCDGEVVQLAHLWKATQRASWTPRYCPLCVQEDRERYGEAYWHTAHQIPLATVCNKHGCRFLNLNIQYPCPALNQKFFPLDIHAKQDTPNYDCQPWELTVSKTVEEYLNLPLEIGPTEGFNNLIESIKNCGDLAFYHQGNISIPPERIYGKLTDFYNSNLITQVFGKTLNTSMVSRLTNWKHRLPDRYILLQVMLGMQTAEVFGERVRDELYEKLIALSEHGGFTTIAEVSEAMGVRECELRVLVRYYGIKPFWVEFEKRKHTTARTGLLRCRVSEDELKAIETMSRELGYHCTGAFALACVRYVMQERMCK